ncbi:MAG: flagellar M-ring protein FliF [Halobacteriovoraceae bacterium]|nr:flagellar M-ring protein FliF [Halobacteriovoraceae bacterium]MCB9095927.1 flagellar M-ring protein FliF [Halobacteriovoraceae bacterium]
MGKTIAESLKNLTDLFSSLDPLKKAGFLAGGILIIAFSIAVVMLASKSNYSILYTNLNKEDSLQVSRFLKESKIPYQVSDDGKTIKIPEDKVEIWRIEIAKRGVKFTSTIGYEVFDKQSFGTTSFVQKINRQRALEGELTKTIKHIDGVNRARVHLSIPESSPFVTETKPPSASVVLELNHGYDMTSEEIKGIAQLISASVDGMRPQNVVILDSRGKKLSDNINDGITAETANRVAFQSKMNQKYEKQIEEILSKVVGEGKVIAKVSVNLDFTEKVETQTSYDPENTAVLSEVQNSQKLDGSRPSPQGIPGARSNLPGETPQPGIPETKTDVDKSFVTRNYQVPKKVTQSRSPTANLKNISAAVMIDGKRTPLLDESGSPILSENGTFKTNYEAWSEEEINNFRDIVVSTLGINPERGDKIVIKNMEFAQEDLSAAEAIIREKERQELLKNLVQYGIVGVIISLFIFLVIRPFIQWITDNSIQTIEDFLPRTIEELEAIQENQKLPGLEEALPTIEDKLNPEKIEGNMLKEKIMGLIESNPSKAAQVVTTMIYDMDETKKIA